MSGASGAPIHSQTVLYNVPFYMGNRLDGLDVPAPHTLIEPVITANREMDRMAELYPHLADAIAGDDHPVVYSGDCCVILPVIAGLQRRDIEPVVVFFDAHGDFNTWETTESDFIGGMPLAMATGRGEMTIADACGMTPVPDEDAFLVDARDLDRAEARLLAESGVHRVVHDELPTRLPEHRPIYIHIDVDVVDPVDMPAVNYLAPGGPSANAIATVVADLEGSFDIVAFSFSSWNPAMDGAELSALNSHRIAAPFLAAS